MGMPGAGVISILDANGTAQLAYKGRCQVVAVRGFQSGLAADAYIQLFDASATSAITVGTTKPTWVVLNDFGSGNVTVGDGLPTHGLIFENGVVVASTTDAANSTGATQQVRIAII